MKIILDTRAVKHLMDTDPEFILSVKRNIVAGLVRDIAVRDAPQIVKEIAPEVISNVMGDKELGDSIRRIVERAAEEMVSYVRHYNGQPVFEPKPQTVTMIKKAVEPMLAQFRTDIVNYAATELNARLAAAKELIDAKIDDRIEHIMDAHIERTVTNKVAERLKQALEFAGKT